jgi:hypothetical protein
MTHRVSLLVPAFVTCSLFAVVAGAQVVVGQTTPPTTVAPSAASAAVPTTSAAPGSTSGAAPAPLVVGSPGQPAATGATPTPSVAPATSAPPALVLLPVAPAAPAAPADPAADPDEAPTDPSAADREMKRRKYGVQASILGPNALVGLGFTAQLAPRFEGILSLGYLQAKATEQTAAATAEASIRLLTPMARGRVWLFSRHALLLDGGVGATVLTLGADGQNRDGTDPIHYERSGVSPIFTGALGYGYRSPASFRFSVLLGVQGMVANLKDSTITAGQAYTAREIADLKKELDDASKQVGAINKAFLEMNVAFLF